MGVVDFASGMHGAIQQQLAERFAAQQYADKLKQQAFQNTMQQRQFDSNEELKRAQMEETSANHQAAEQDRKIGLASSLADQIPGGQFMAPEDPAVGMLRTGGRGSLLTPQEERPAVETGPLLPGDTGAAKAQGFIKTRSAKQVDTETDNARQATAAAEQATRDAETGRHNKAMENKPVSEQGWTIQQGTVNGKPGWVRINSHTGAVQPVSAGEITPKPSAQEAQETRTKTDTLDTLSQLDRAIEDAKDMLGPGAGRFSNFEQMAGSADPRIQALGVKMKAAKMRVDHAMTGSVRAGASPQMMQQWDNILANKVTPEGLKAGVQAMREILGGGQAPATGGSKIKSITEIP